MEKQPYLREEVEVHRVAGVEVQHELEVVANVQLLAVPLRGPLGKVVGL